MRGAVRSRARRREGAPGAPELDGAEKRALPRPGPSLGTAPHASLAQVQSAPRRRDTGNEADGRGVAPPVPSSSSAPPLPGKKTAGIPAAKQSAQKGGLSTGAGSATIPSPPAPAAASPSALLGKKAAAPAAKQSAPKGGVQAAALVKPPNKVPPRRTDALYKEWSVEEVRSWCSEIVRKEGIPGEVAILSAMQEHAIKGSHLVMLSPLLLREELSFGALGHRLTFLQARDKLVAQDQGASAVDRAKDTARMIENLSQSVKTLTLKVEEMALKRGLSAPAAAAPIAERALRVASPAVAAPANVKIAVKKGGKVKATLPFSKDKDKGLVSVLPTGDVGVKRGEGPVGKTGKDGVKKAEGVPQESLQVKVKLDYTEGLVRVKINLIESSSVVSQHEVTEAMYSTPAEMEKPPELKASKVVATAPAKTAPANPDARTEVSALRMEIANAVEAAVLSAYAFTVRSGNGTGWSDDFEELDETERVVNAMLETSGHAAVTVVYSPPKSSLLDACMIVDIVISRAPADAAAAATKEWAKLVESGWKAASLPATLS